MSRRLVTVLVLLLSLSLNGCKLGLGGGSGSSTPGAVPGVPTGGGPAPLIGAISVDLRKGK